MQPHQHRLHTLDFARGLSVFIMVCVHTLWMYATIDTQANTFFGHTIHVLGKGTASFLVAMGISLALSRRNTPAALVIRGLIILALGFFMNTLKFILPIALGTMPESFIQAYGWQSPLSHEQLLFMFLTGDILQLAGVSLLLIAGLNILQLRRHSLLVLALLIAVASQLMRGFILPSPLSYLSELFFSASYQVYFPVMPWISAILVGQYLGRCYTEQQLSADDLFKKGGVLGLVLLIAGLLACWYDPKTQFANFFHLNFGGIAYLTGLNLCLLYLLHRYLMPRILLSRTHRVVQYASRHVTALYIIQWTLICWGMGMIGYATLNSWQTFLMMPVMLTLTLIVHKGLILPAGHMVKELFIKARLSVTGTAT